ncbi:LON peptidase substrate-binding domain-containing protein [Bailinhaonella thermotolerans]|uniref:Peptidase S16 n=1 Tax=Bailinhaonella thermotolerans TaxID=1070861 RepID=A0A3A4ANG2_9ACTN|nr:LON peptidase substrate-binding domain-containing protein [Bailinhaonella thermotolerans]RJL31206.1 peptidase S16 [Bailinhaonella thermotolerans]
MSERLAIFPLGTVLFPGVPLPLHVFEERYRLLVRRLLGSPGPRRFGVVSIVLGHEVGAGAARELASVGCVAEVREVEELPDGRFRVFAVGGERFRVGEVDASGPYLEAGAHFLPEEAGPGADELARRVTPAFRRYFSGLARVRGEPAVTPPVQLSDEDLPADPIALSYLVGAGLLVGRAVKQRLLAAGTAAERLAAELELLGAETRLLTSLPSVPVADFLDKGVNPN